MFPAPRVGYLVVPPSLTPAFAAAKWLNDQHSATLAQEALAEFISSGAYVPGRARCTGAAELREHGRAFPLRMRVLVIGGTRFIGPYVVRDLCASGHDVTVFHRGEHDSPLLPDVRHVRSPDAGMPVLRFPNALLDPWPQVVIHMMAMGEADARAAVHAFAGRVERLVVPSSGDVYRAYGRFTGFEPGPIEHGLLTEDSPLREKLFPYRTQAQSPSDLKYFYEKILVERAVMTGADLSACVLRLPKVYGPGDNADLATVFANREHPQWRWTHLYVENVAAAIVLAAVHPAAAGRVYNIGEARTPTVAERIARLPRSSVPVAPAGSFEFSQDIAYDTTRIRAELGYVEPVSEEEGLRRTLAGP